MNFKVMAVIVGGKTTLDKSLGEIGPEIYEN